MNEVARAVDDIARELRDGHWSATDVSGVETILDDIDKSLSTIAGYLEDISRHLAEIANNMPALS